MRFLILSVSLIVTAAVGLYSKRYYHGPAEAWVHDSLGGVFYEILWCIVVAMIARRVRSWRIATGVLIVTCLLEFLQAWHPPLLEAARRTFLGRTILGSYFDWGDFPYYFVGSALGWLWIRWVRHR